MTIFIKYNQFPDPHDEVFREILESIETVKSIERENMKEQDLSKIDWKKLELPKWKGMLLGVELIAGRIHLRTDRAGTYAYHRNKDSNDSNEWKICLQGRDATFTELDQLRAMCSQVDVFIATELAKLNAPDWVEVKWTEVVRLVKSGAHAQYFNDELRCYVDREEPTDLAGSSIKYQVDRKTVPAGVALYEPEWVDVDWRDVKPLENSGAKTQVRSGSGTQWKNRNPVEAVIGGPDLVYRADRKTFPDGFELGKREQVKPEQAKPVKVGVGYKVTLDSNTFSGDHVIVSLCSSGGGIVNARLVKEQEKQTTPPKPAPRPCTKDFALEHPGESEYRFSTREWSRIGGCIAFSGGYEFRTVAPNEPERPWVKCTRKEAEDYPAESETRSIRSGVVCGIWRDKVTSRIDGFDYEFRTRANVPEWVTVPLDDYNKMQNGITVSGTTGDAVICMRRYLLPANYVLGVGFVEQYKVVESVRKTSHELLAHLMENPGKWVKAKAKTSEGPRWIRYTAELGFRQVNQYDSRSLSSEPREGAKLSHVDMAAFWKMGPWEVNE